MAAAWLSGPALLETVAVQFLGVLWFVSATTGPWGAAAAGGEETLKCEDLKVGQYPLRGASPGEAEAGWRGVVAPAAGWGRAGRSADLRPLSPGDAGRCGETRTGETGRPGPASSGFYDGWRFSCASTCVFIFILLVLVGWCVRQTRRSWSRHGASLGARDRTRGRASPGRSPSRGETRSRECR